MMTKCKMLCVCPDLNALSPIHEHPVTKALVCANCNKFMAAAALASSRNNAKSIAKAANELLKKYYAQPITPGNKTWFSLHPEQEKIAFYYGKIYGQNKGGVNESTDESHEEAF